MSKILYQPSLENNHCFFEWGDFIHAAYCNESFILLRILDNDYAALDPRASSVLEFVLKTSFLKDDGGLYFSKENNASQYKLINDHIRKFVKEGVIKETSNRLRNNKYASPSEPGGIHVQAWQSDNNSHLKVEGLLILKSIYLLYRIHYILKKYRIQGIVSFLKEASIGKTLINSTIDKSKILSRAVEIASLFQPKNTMCLPFAATLALLHYKQGYRCDFVIGVQNTPFHAHAWVEVNDMILNDRSELKTKLAPIFAIRF